MVFDVSYVILNIHKASLHKSDPLQRGSMLISIREGVWLEAGVWMTVLCLHWGGGEGYEDGTVLSVACLLNKKSLKAPESRQQLSLWGRDKEKLGDANSAL